jgi:flagellar protein FlaI
MKKTIKSSVINLYGTQIKAEVLEGDDVVRGYKVNFPEVSPATQSVLESVKDDMLKGMKVGAQEVFEARAVEKMRDEFIKKSKSIISERLPSIDPKTRDSLLCHLLCEMIGIGPLEIPMEDPDLEEVVVNSAKEPVWVFHKNYGWLKTNIILGSEQQIQNYASIIARRAGRQITMLDPLLDAHLVSGDRANATLFPISTKGNTITIRKFRRKPWTITDFIENKTITSEVAAFLWLVIQYELNMIVAGGTSSGKTALLNSLMPFIQSNHRIISIEDTRELSLPYFLHWVPLTTRLPNPEGKGSVSMLDLMVNSLRMRPDRIVVGEIRRGRQAEVLFEAMHTGHSVYATLHADTAEQVVRRMTNPPINIPPVMLEALHLIVVQYRDRRLGIRRVYQVAELLPPGDVEEKRKAKISVLYRLKPDGTIASHNPCIRVFDVLRMHTGMTDKEFYDDIKEKMKILDYMVKNKINEVNDVGNMVAQYYSDKEALMKKIK